MDHVLPNYHLVNAKLGDNPHLPAQYVQNLIREFINSPALYRRLVLGEWGIVQSGDPVFGGIFVKTTHMKLGLKFDPKYPILRGWDTGWYHPCCVFNQMVGEQMRTLRVMMGSKVHLDVFIRRIKDYSAMEFPNGRYIDFADPHNLDAPSDLAELNRLQTFHANKIMPRYRHSRVSMGLDIMARKMGLLVKGEPAYVISDHPSCELLIDAMEAGYCYMKPPEESGGKKLTKEQQKEPYKDGYYDHSVDCTRYIFVGLLGPGSESNQVVPMPDVAGYHFGGKPGQVRAMQELPSGIFAPKHDIIPLGKDDHKYLEQIRRMYGFVGPTVSKEGN